MIMCSKPKNQSRMSSIVGGPLGMRLGSAAAALASSSVSLCCLSQHTTTTAEFCASSAATPSSSSSSSLQLTSPSSIRCPRLPSPVVVSSSMTFDKGSAETSVAKRAETSVAKRAETSVAKSSKEKVAVTGSVANANGIRKTSHRPPLQGFYPPLGARSVKDGSCLLKPAAESLGRSISPAGNSLASGGGDQEHDREEEQTEEGSPAVGKDDDSSASSPVTQVVRGRVLAVLQEKGTCPAADVIPILRIASEFMNVNCTETIRLMLHRIALKHISHPLVNEEVTGFKDIEPTASSSMAVAPVGSSVRPDGASCSSSSSTIASSLRPVKLSAAEEFLRRLLDLPDRNLERNDKRRSWVAARELSSLLVVALAVYTSEQPFQGRFGEQLMKHSSAFLREHEGDLKESSGLTAKGKEYHPLWSFKPVKKDPTVKRFYNLEYLRLLLRCPELLRTFERFDAVRKRYMFLAVRDCPTWQLNVGGLRIRVDVIFPELFIRGEMKLRRACGIMLTTRDQPGGLFAVRECLSSAEANLKKGFEQGVVRGRTCGSRLASSAAGSRPLSLSGSRSSVSGGSLSRPPSRVGGSKSHQVCPLLTDYYAALVRGTLDSLAEMEETAERTPEPTTEEGTVEEAQELRPQWVTKEKKRAEQLTKEERAELLREVILRIFVVDDLYAPSSLSDGTPSS